MSEVDWNDAPHGAQFYSMGKFRKIKNGCEYFYGYAYDCDLGWWKADLVGIDYYKQADDFEMRPVATQGKPDAGAEEQSAELRRMLEVMNGIVPLSGYMKELYDTLKREAVKSAF